GSSAAGACARFAKRDRSRHRRRLPGAARPSGREPPPAYPAAGAHGSLRIRSSDGARSGASRPAPAGRSTGRRSPARTGGSSTSSPEKTQFVCYDGALSHRSETGGRAHERGLAGRPSAITARGLAAGVDVRPQVALGGVVGPAVGVDHRSLVRLVGAGGLAVGVDLRPLVSRPENGDALR